MKLRRMTALVLACILLLLLTGCGKKEEKPEAAETVQASSNLKTNIFSGEELPLPEGMEYWVGTTLYWDADERTVTCIAALKVETETEDGTVMWESLPYLVTTSMDGVKDTRPVPVPEGMSIFRARVTSDGTLCILYDAEADCCKAMRWNPETGESWQSGELNAYFEDKAASVQSILEDSAGKIYLIAPGQLIILNSDWTVKKSVRLDPVESVSLGMDGDGQVYALLNNDLSVTFLLIDAESGEPGEPVTISGTNLLFGGAFPYCWRTSEGISAAQEDGEVQEVMNFRNSGLAATVMPLLVPDGDTVLLLEDDSTSMFAGIAEKLMLYTRQPDVDMSQARILRIASMGTMNRQVTAFMKKHPDVIVDAVDYSGFGPTAEGPGGRFRLAREIATGTCKADILIGEIGYDDIFLTTAYEKEFCVDLTPYLETDEELNFDSLFSASYRMFDDGKGTVWGILPSIRFDTVLAPTAILGKYAEQGYWTLSELMDFYGSLPEGMAFMLDLTRETAADFLFKNMAYREFMDAESGTCSFDSPEFIRVLEWIHSLPTGEEYRRSSPFAEMEKAERTAAYWNGKIAAQTGSFTEIPKWGKLGGLFNDPDVTAIGYPTAEKRAGAGTVVGGTGVVITKASDNADLAWEFVKSLFSDSDFQFYAARKTDFESQVARYAAADFVTYMDGPGAIYSKGLGDKVIDEPCVITHLGEEDIAALEELLDSAGMSILDMQSGDVYAIIKEELSAFLSGVGSAEDCAKKIQSRAGIWLAEHKS